MSESQNIFSICKGAKYLGIGKNALYSFVRQGLIPVVTYPDRTRCKVTREALDAFRDAHTGTIGGPIESDALDQLQENKGRYESSPRMTKSREAQLDEVFARK